MPLPYFLMLIAAVIIAAGATLWVGSSFGFPTAALPLGAMIGAAIVHLGRKDGRL